MTRQFYWLQLPCSPLINQLSRHSFRMAVCYMPLAICGIEFQKNAQALIQSHGFAFALLIIRSVSSRALEACITTTTPALSPRATPPPRHAKQRQTISSTQRKMAALTENSSAASRSTRPAPARSGAAFPKKNIPTDALHRNVGQGRLEVRQLEGPGQALRICDGRARSSRAGTRGVMKFH